MTVRKLSDIYLNCCGGHGEGVMFTFDFHSWFYDTPLYRKVFVLPLKLGCKNSGGRGSGDTERKPAAFLVYLFLFIKLSILYKNSRHSIVNQKIYDHHQLIPGLANADILLRHLQVFFIK